MRAFEPNGVRYSAEKNVQNWCNRNITKSWWDRKISRVVLDPWVF